MVACVTVIVLLVVIFAVNYVRMMSIERDTHTAVEAACLQAANDLSSVVIDGPIGRISLIDDASVKRPYIPSRDTYSGATIKPTPKSEEVRQVKSVNTLLAEIRLRALIASQPEIGNSTMTYRAGADLKLARETINALRYRLTNTLTNQMPVYDKAGLELNVQQDVFKAYSDNQQKLGRVYCRLENVVFRLGTLSNLQGRAVGTLPTPRPADCDPETVAEGGYYKAYKDYSLPGLSAEKIDFIPDCRRAKLADNDAFVPLDDSSVFPCAVQIEGDEMVTMISPVGGEKPRTSKIHFTATAQLPCGPVDGLNNQLEASPSGSFLLTFPQGFPNVSDEDRFNFYSLISIMNASSLDASNVDSPSPYRYWNSQSVGTWRVAHKGPVPGGGALVPRPYLNLKERQTDDPSVALSFLVYDWLASLGLKPNVESVIKALTFDLRAYRLYRHNPSIEFSTIAQLADVIPAYADLGERNSVISAVLNVDPTGQTDPRNLANWARNPHLYGRQQARMWSYAGALPAFPYDSVLVKINDDGSVTTTDGNSADQVTEFMNDILAMNHIGWQTYLNTLTVLNQKIAFKFETLKAQQVPAVAVTSEVFTENKRLANALKNAQYCMAVSVAMKRNLKALTANGLRKVNSRHYAMDTVDFYPPTKPAEISDLIGQSVSDTGQDVVLSNRNWCGEKPIFVTGSKVVKLTTHLPSWQCLPQAEATSLSYSKWNKFLFHLDLQTPSRPYQGEILMHRLETSPYATVPLLKGQMHYQNTCALISEATGNPAFQVCWQVQARDMNANHFVGFDADLKGQQAEVAAYFADMDLNSYNGQVCKTSPMRGVCPPLAAEFSILCPLVKAPAPFDKKPIALWSNWAVLPAVSSALSDQLVSVETGWQPTVYTNDGTVFGKFKGRLSENSISRQWWQDERWHSDWWLTTGKFSKVKGFYPEPPPLVI